MARRGGGLANLRSGAFDAAAADCRALLNRFGGVAGIHLDFIKWHVELFGDKLR
jgi:hypothetical protein